MYIKMLLLLKNKKCISNLICILLNQIRLDPKKRLSAKELKYEIDEIIKKIDILELL